jgi:hypothetical protein
MTSPPPIACAICSRPMTLEECKIDEYGQPVHEQCQYTRLSMKPPTNNGTPPAFDEES